ncbi:MAG TPA: glycine cleavage system aminomethyltransferase GcvT [Phycisphaerales bacterium]|nr:glycine cleavage system aminomethyltransferase GcvT [Phycisphaerales bacterium]HCD34809.1 glycine cleavage system aminomethyltransferase GcvT [Phycisphaerales bacterium]|tara:strand:+ start:2905 stop:4038 length:1134 start_codon:yes stop_codon:yes gene_type:complete
MTKGIALQRTAFYKFHSDRGAKFVDFAGWEMPISFGSVIDEHNQVRTKGGLFDVSHMGRLKLTGRHVRRLLERILTRYITDMADKSCRYALVCNEQGGVLDDVILYKFPSHYMLVVNASNRQKILEHLNTVAKDESLIVKIDDQTESTAMVALQGPRVMEKIGEFSREVPTLKRYSFCEKNLLILKMTISRTGYTGEDGVEVIMGSMMAEKAIKLLVKESPNPEENVMSSVGLAARDTLRLEAAMPLYGHELSETIDPLTAGLDFAVTLNKEELDRGEKFIGQDALKAIKAAGLKQKRVGIKFEGKRTPRQDMTVVSDGSKVGYVTSGCLSPTLGYPIAMAYVDVAVSEIGTKLSVDLGNGKTIDGEVVALPFYKKP